MRCLSFGAGCCWHTAASGGMSSPDSVQNRTQLRGSTCFQNANKLLFSECPQVCAPVAQRAFGKVWTPCEPQPFPVDVHVMLLTLVIQSECSSLPLPDRGSVLGS
ncbi:hypothetical protein H8959_007257 [Pygathrix nigripes]